MGKGEIMTDSFDIFWEAYPRKVGKKPAQQKFAKAVRLHGFATIMAGLEKWQAAWVGTDKQFIPHASTWLFQERYRDEPDAKAPQDGTLPRRIETTTPITAAMDALLTLSKGQPLDEREIRALREWDGPIIQARAKRMGLTLPPVSP